MQKYLVEFIGTFFLVLAVVMSVLGGVGNLAPIAIGSTLMVMIYAGGYVSGAHYNPAVTIAVWIRGKCETSDVLPYIISQLVAAFVASKIAIYLLASLSTAVVPTVANISPMQTVLAEFLGTFALCYVILNVATASKLSGNSFYGAAIAFTVVASAYVLGGISGGVFNPAVFLGISLSGMQSFANLWIYMIGELAAAITAAFVFKFIDKESEA